MNPIAGMGGRVGLKGTDGPDVLQQALEKGAVPEAPQKAEYALKQLLPLKDQIELLTFSGDMGGRPAERVGLSPRIVGTIKNGIGPGGTSPEDTMDCARTLRDLSVDLLLFAGGDGTARNVYDAIGLELPVIGIPAGVKIHSAVFGTTPDKAGELALAYLKGGSVAVREREVMDIDEEAFRAGRVSAALHGYLRVPEREGLVQSLKSASSPGEGVSITHIADHVIASMEPDTYYLIGPGTTTRRIMERLNLDYSLLGVDVVRNGQLIEQDVGERELLKIVNQGAAKIIVTVIGGQGYIFGRGNQQFSPDVLSQVGKQNITVIAPQEKLASLGGNPLLIDTGSPEMNQKLSGYYRVIVSFKREIMYPAQR